MKVPDNLKRTKTISEIGFILFGAERLLVTKGYDDTPEGEFGIRRNHKKYRETFQVGEWHFRLGEGGEWHAAATLFEATVGIYLLVHALPKRCLSTRDVLEKIP